MLARLSNFVWIFLTTVRCSELMIQWNDWAPCVTKQENCDSRNLICEASSSYKHLCPYGDSVIQEYRINCKECTEEWITTLESTGSPSSDKQQHEISYCSNNSACKRRLIFPRFDRFPCPGEWKEERLCNTSCAESGSEMIIRKIFSPLPTNLPCFQVNNIYRIQTINQSCDNDVCNLWSAWEEISPCSKSCGGGEITQTRSCLNATGCANSEDTQTRQVTCNVHSCPSWSAWSSNQTCDQPPRTRICLDRGSLANTCGDENLYFQTSTACSHISNQSEAIRKSCHEMLIIIIIPVVTGVLILFLMFVALFCCLRRSKQQEFATEDSQLAEKSYSNGKFVDLASDNMSVEVKLTSYNFPTNNNEVKAAPARISSLNLICEDEAATSPTSIPQLSKDILSSGGGDINPPPRVVHKFASSPDIVNETNRFVEPEREPSKPRPSVRRAELLRLKNEQRVRRNRRRREQEDLAWSQTQTLRPSINEDSRSENNESREVNRLRSHSVDASLEIDFEMPPTRVENDCAKKVSKTPMHKINSDCKYSLPNDETNEASRCRSYSASCFNLTANGLSHAQEKITSVQQKNYISDASERRYRRSHSIQPPAKPKRNNRNRDSSFSEVPLHVSRSTDLMTSIHVTAPMQCHSLHRLSEANYRDNA